MSQRRKRAADEGADEDTLLPLAREDLRSLLRSLDAPVEACIERLEAYRILLQAEAEKWNITRYKKNHEVILYHFVDSLQALRCEGIEEACEVMDVGSGAGLPGVPCAIARPGWDITFLDSSEKRGQFLRQVVERILPGRGRVVVDRAEAAAHLDHERGRCGLVLARAVAPLPVLLEITLPFLKPGGLLAVHRGGSWREDLASSGEALAILHGEFVGALPYRLRARDTEHAVLAVRLRAAPDLRIPRSPARIRRKPLG